MRIIGGEYRGRVLKMPRGIRIRPTQDRVREAIFNIIRAGIPQSRVLDLYAGSGAFGIEALSRGAHSVISVDNNVNCMRTIKSNLSILGRGSIQLIKLDALRAISRFKRENKEFDIIFLDPPYHKNLARNCLIKINACDILSQHGFAICEHFVKDIMPERIGSLFCFKKRKYGDTVVSFYRKTEDTT